MNHPASSPEVIWTPSEELRSTCALTRFIERVRAHGIPGITDYESLHRWSVREPAAFWPLAMQFLDIAHEGALSPIYDSGEGLTPLAKRWFPHVRLNFAENLLRGDAQRCALISWSEDMAQRRMTLADVRAAAGALQAYFGSMNLAPREHVFAFLPNIPEGVVAMIAATSRGATWGPSCGTDYQLQGLLARAQRGPKPRVLVAARSYVWRGTVVDLSGTIREFVEQTPSIEHLLLIDYAPSGPAADLQLRAGVEVALYKDLVANHAAIDLSQRFSFDHPLFVMFSSGTTGTPKGIVHGAGGTLLEHKKEMILHADVRRGDRVFYQTSPSWMMWNWVVSALACEATVVMYDGDPMLENGQILWRLAAQERVTHFGTSAAFLGAIEKQGVCPNTDADLAELRAILSTGSTLYPSQFDYIMRAIKPLWIQSISGGTDIIGCFGLGCPLKPVRRGEVQCKSLGYDVQVLNAEGHPVVGEEGELVCGSPAPSMPVFFLDDPSGDLYRAAYFSEYGTKWRHGDVVRESPTGDLTFLGRSDATLKPSGVRIATADLYSALQSVSRVRQAIAIGYTPSGGTNERIVLFVTLAPNDVIDDALRGEITRTLKAVNSFFAPALVVHAPDLPRTANNKLSEVTVKRIIHGLDPGNRAALANPDSLAFYQGEGRSLVRQALG